MSETKVIITGSVGAGKTSAIASVSEIPLIKVQPPELTVSPRQLKTTITIDYGELTLVDGHKIRIYGTEGYQRFDYLWKILIKGAMGLIILVDNSGHDPMGELARYLDNFREFLSQTQTIIGVTRMDVSSEPNLQSYHSYLQEQSIKVPVLSIDARSQQSVKMVVQTLMESNKMMRSC